MIKIERFKYGLCTLKDVAVNLQSDPHAIADFNNRVTRLNRLVNAKTILGNDLGDAILQNHPDPLYVVIAFAHAGTEAQTAYLPEAANHRRIMHYPLYALIVGKLDKVDSTEHIAFSPFARTNEQTLFLSDASVSFLSPAAYLRENEFSVEQTRYIKNLRDTVLHQLGIGVVRSENNKITIPTSVSRVDSLALIVNNLFRPSTAALIQGAVPGDVSWYLPVVGQRTQRMGRSEKVPEAVFTGMPLGSWSIYCLSQSQYNLLHSANPPSRLTQSLS